jgi:hypothetical protein
MTIYDFITLNNEEQAKVLGAGNILAHRDELNCKVLLYRMNDFFVEVYYNRSYRNIQSIKPFHTSALLNLYFDSRMN